MRRFVRNVSEGPVVWFIPIEEIAVDICQGFNLYELFGGDAYVPVEEVGDVVHVDVFDEEFNVVGDFVVGVMHVFVEGEVVDGGVGGM